MRTYHEQKGLTLQAGWEDRVDFDINLYRDVPSMPSKIPIPIAPPRPLAPIDLEAEKAREVELVLVRKRIGMLFVDYQLLRRIVIQIACQN